jgi:predicted CXXCH cytochrome family protein
MCTAWKRRPGGRTWAALLAVCLWAGAVPSRAAQGAKPNSCVDCHAELPDGLGAPVRAIGDDVHGKHGLSCADCHGGDPADPDMTSMDPEKGFRGAPEKMDVPDFCGRCHSDPAYIRQFDPSLPTDQLERYRTSVHGKRLAAGDTNVASCTDCHGSHGMLSGREIDSRIYPANIPGTCGHCHSRRDLMAPYGLPFSQERDYRGSVHGKLLLEQRDLSAPTCSTCHDNHGASPPGATSIADVCGLCHVNNRDFFVASPHKKGFDDRGLSECVTCHGNHAVTHTSDAMLGVGEKALCRGCHSPASAGFVAARRMRSAIEELKGAIEGTDAELRRAEQLGMEVSDARYDFHGVGAMLIKARTSVHRFAAEPVVEEVGEGLELCSKTRKIADDAIEEAETRRRQLVYPIGAIAALIVALALKLRQIERR